MHKVFVIGVPTLQEKIKTKQGCRLACGHHVDSWWFVPLENAYIKWRNIYVTRWVRDELYFSLVWVSDSSMLREFSYKILHFAPKAHGAFCWWNLQKLWHMFRYCLLESFWKYQTLDIFMRLHESSNKVRSRLIWWLHKQWRIRYINYLEPHQGSNLL